MFDQLHDPDPPAPTSHHLAEVAERAAGLRRRRTAVVSGVAAIGLVAAGTIAVAATQATDTNDLEVADVSLPATAPAGADPLDPPAPTTTALDPESLPPAVPVNPDPSDLPPAVPVDADEVDNAGSSDTGGEDPTGSDGGSAEQSEEPTEPGSAPDESADGTDEGGADDPTPTLDAATAAALRSADPVVAVTRSGEAVWFASLDQEPIVVDAGGGITRLDFLGDGSSTIERAGGTAIAVTSVDDGEAERLHVGVAHEVGPDGETVCGLIDGGTVVACATRDGEREIFEGAERAIDGVDLTWFDTDTVLVIGRSDAWTLTEVELADGSVTTTPFASLGDFDQLRFGGRDAAGALAVHDAGTEVVLVGTLDRFGRFDSGGDGVGGTALEVRRFDEPMRSVWYDGGTEILVTADGVLTIDGADVDGAYVTARR